VHALSYRLKFSSLFAYNKRGRENYDVEEVANDVSYRTQQTRERSENKDKSEVVGLTTFCGPCQVRPDQKTKREIRRTHLMDGNLMKYKVVSANASDGIQSSWGLSFV
jgi:hypothetical protein